MGMIYGQYDAKEQKKGEQGFVPGGSSIHACMYVTLRYLLLDEERENFLHGKKHNFAPLCMLTQT
jgi:homogentisate 1,2-dioxygenase